MPLTAEPAIICFAGVPALGCLVFLADLLKSRVKKTCCPCGPSSSKKSGDADPVKGENLLYGISPLSKALEGYGENLFKGSVAAPYLQKHGLSVADLESGKWATDPAKADLMAFALRDWAVARGAKNFCHVFQPMASTYRHGQVGCVQLAMFEFERDGKPVWDFKGKNLLQGETDGSSYPSGGLRATHTAGGYLTVDPDSPVYLKGDCIFVPACFVSFEGKALDEKTPLKRSVQALSRSGRRLFKALGVDIDGMTVNIGLEQEFFFVPRDQYFRRPDLQMVGRTLMGRLPARGQELCDHYMAPANGQGAAFKCMQEIQEECYKMGIPLKTRHREVAPNQYEFAPLFGPVGEHTDENLRLMQIMEEVSVKHGLACLLQEKPFQGINGSGKHNNWSISIVKKGKQTNIYNPMDLMKATGKPEIFPILMACTVAAVDKFGDLMRAAIACPGNDFRLGAMEAPPAVISTYLGPQVTEYLQQFVNGDTKEYMPRQKKIDLGVAGLPQITAPAEDRNRTSPFPFGGHRFEFRACGSSQNVSLVNTVLATMMANEFREMAERAEEGYSAAQVAQVLLKTHSKCVYNGNGYDPEWPEKAVARGVCRIDSGVDAVCKLTDQKNIDLFVKAGVFTAEECQARRTVLLELYVGTVEMECLAMIDMINQHVIPSMKAAGKPDFIARLEGGQARLKDGLKIVHASHDEVNSAKAARCLRLETMIEVRAICDEAEGMCPENLWTLASYKELLFLDMNEPSRC